MSRDRNLKQAIAYTRVSTEKQGAGFGPEFQMTSISAYADHEGYEIVRTFNDAHTGMGEDSIHERPGIRAAIDLSRETGWPILLDDLDRFSRNTKTVADALKDSALRVIACRSNVHLSGGAAAAAAARSEREVEVIREHTKLALKKLKDEGVLLGNRTNLPEAQAKGSAANKDQAQQRAHELAPVVQELRAQGRTTAKAIAEGLNLRDLRTPKGREWDQWNVRRLLERIEEISQIEQRRIEQQKQLDEERRKEMEENKDWGSW